MPSFLVFTICFTNHFRQRAGGGRLQRTAGPHLFVSRSHCRSTQHAIGRLLGLELTQATYDRGNAFVDGVVERAAAEGLARLWQDERLLPSPPEIDAPGLWLARIDLPETPETPGT